MSAIETEKRIKAWRRDKKEALIEISNPTWEDLSAGWYDRSNEAGSSLRSE
jgi:predicted GIY-YIG superfamily endonuclease